MSPEVLSYTVLCSICLSTDFISKTSIMMLIKLDITDCQHQKFSSQIKFNLYPPNTIPALHKAQNKLCL
jgi:hypothetical protein